MQVILRRFEIDIGKEIGKEIGIDDFPGKR